MTLSSVTKWRGKSKFKSNFSHLQRYCILVLPMKVSGPQGNSGNEKYNNVFSNAWISFTKQENFRITPEMRYCNLKHAGKMPAMVLNF